MTLENSQMTLDHSQMLHNSQTGHPLDNFQMTQAPLSDDTAPLSDDTGPFSDDTGPFSNNT